LFRPASIGLHVTFGRAVDERLRLIVHWTDRPGLFLSLGAVPLGKKYVVVSVVIDATQMDRLGKTGKTQLFTARFGDIERLQIPRHVRAIDLFLAGEFLWDTVGNECCIHGGAVIEVLADLVPWPVALGLRPRCCATH
jgi:hypothetical protein